MHVLIGGTVHTEMRGASYAQAGKDSQGAQPEPQGSGEALRHQHEHDRADRTSAHELVEDERRSRVRTRKFARPAGLRPVRFTGAVPPGAAASHRKADHTQGHWPDRRIQRHADPQGARMQGLLPDHPHRVRLVRALWRHQLGCDRRLSRRGSGVSS